MSPVLSVVLVLIALAEAVVIGVLCLVRSHVDRSESASGVQRIGETSPRYPDIEVGWGRAQRIVQLEQENERLRFQLARQLHIDGVSR